MDSDLGLILKEDLVQLIADILTHNLPYFHSHVILFYKRWSPRLLINCQRTLSLRMLQFYNRIYRAFKISGVEYMESNHLNPILTFIKAESWD